ncbi:response regulator [Fulvimarina endophytica]|uniref:Response regulator n=1 Tax=Fulvimarina endophytica TaxID=2293836 RepID=A0A371X144_9HYPH|nr:response regulator [Fulvimarina endophytica]RFC62943.1 response regulator [Fulvimarina endophytica]
MTTCLLFDEMPVIRKVAERLLERMGYTTTVFESIGAFNAHLGEHGAPDLVILSATGGGVGVPEAVRSVRFRSPHTVIVVSLVDRNIGTLMRLRRAGANGILMKPFDADGFKGTLEVHLSAAKLTAA